MRGADGAEGDDGGGGGGGGGTINQVVGFGIDVANPMGPTTSLTATPASIGADPAGSAASAIGAHEAAIDPHPQYTTAPEAAAAAPVQSVAGKTGSVLLVVGDVAGAAPTASPTFSGAVSMSGAASVSVPTVAYPDSDTSAASTAFVSANFAPQISPTLTGTVTMTGATAVSVPTVAVPDSDTTAASTAFVNNAFDYFVETAQVVRLVDDFLAGTVAGSLGWSSASNGAGNVVAPNTSIITGAKGFMVLNAGTNAATGRAALSFEATAGQLPLVTPWVDGLITVEYRVQLQALPVVVTADYQPNVALGGGATTAAAGFADGVGFFCNGSNANWIFASRTASTTIASVNTGVAVAASTWIYMRIEVDSVSARGYIGATKATAVLVATIAIASVTTTAALGPMMKTFNIAGGVAREFRIDYMRLIHMLTTSR